MQLHVTNGDSTVALMKQAGIKGCLLPWRDVLHDGPCPAGVSLEDFSERRALFIAGLGGTSLDKVRRKFRERDEVIQRADDFDEIVLWFEHDLYDQLQLIQLLDLLKNFSGNLQLIKTGTHLGLMEPGDIQQLIGTRDPVSDAQIDIAVRGWRAFCAVQPLGLVELLNSDTDDLPYLLPSIRRLLAEYPATDNGLPRTESEILQILKNASCTFNVLFRRYQASEEAAYMGDWSFSKRLEWLGAGERPLIEKTGDVFANTDLGVGVLQKQADWTDLAPMDRYIGGVHLQGRSQWRWNRETQQIAQVNQ